MGVVPAIALRRINIDHLRVDKPQALKEGDFLLVVTLLGVIGHTQGLGEVGHGHIRLNAELVLDDQLAARSDPVVAERIDAPRLGFVEIVHDTEQSCELITV